MRDELGRIRRGFITKVIILVLGFSVILAAITAIFWRTVPNDLMLHYVGLVGFIWIGFVIWAVVFWRYMEIDIALPLMDLGRGIEAQKIIGVPIAVANYRGTFVEPLAKLLVQDAPITDDASSAERSYFAELLQVLDQAVLIIANDHRLLLVNERAREVFAAFGRFQLGRDILDIFDQSAIEGAIVRQEMSSNLSGERLFLASRNGSTVIPAILTLLHDGKGARLGYVVTAHDSSRNLISLHKLERAYDELMISSRRFAQTAIMAAATDGNDTFLSVGLEHAKILHEFRERGEALTGNTWFKSRIPLRVFVTIVQESISQINLVSKVPGDVDLFCDPAAITAVLKQLVRDTRDTSGGNFALHIEVNEKDVNFVLKAKMQIPIDIVEFSQSRILSQLASAPTAEEVMRAHSTEIWPHADDDGTALTFVIERSVPREALAKNKTDYFDFSAPSHSPSFADAPMSQIGMVVFDTETTGLDPVGGDQVVSLSAVRVLNGRVIARENFDRLVNPDRNIPASSTQIHGITNAMVADAPRFDAVLAEFHKFVNGAPIVAHNAAFDMAFIRRAEATAGVTFNQPILDTVFMSAFLYDHSAAHTLDDLAARLDVTIAKSVRHTALGDAVATAEVFTRMLPLLSARGVDRMDQMIEIGNRMRQINRAQRYYGV